MGRIALSEMRSRTIHDYPTPMPVTPEPTVVTVIDPITVGIICVLVLFMAALGYWAD